MSHSPDAFPCAFGDQCPYEYGLDPDRDLEGMPLIDGDLRSGPDYGHVCPHFMEKYNLTPAELEIRATIHCFLVMSFTNTDDLKKPEFQGLFERYIRVLREFPPDEYPQYYDRM